MSDPQTRTGGGLGAVLLGVLLCGVLHVLASVVVVAVGSAVSKDGGLVVLIFWAALGAAQWTYLLPAGLLLRWLDRRGVAKGIWIGGGVGTLLSAGCWGLLALGNLTG